MTCEIDSLFLACLGKSAEDRSKEDFDLIYENLKNLKTLSTFKDTTIWCISRFIRHESHEKDTYLFKTGELIQSWYIILTGSLSIGKDKLNPISKFGRKTHFQTKRIVDCQFLENSNILVIDYQDNLVTKSTHSPKIYADLSGENVWRPPRNDTNRDSCSPKSASSGEIPIISLTKLDSDGSELNETSNEINHSNNSESSTENPPKRIKLCPETESVSSLSDNQSNLSPEEIVDVSSSVINRMPNPIEDTPLVENYVQNIDESSNLSIKSVKSESSVIILDSDDSNDSKASKNSIVEIDSKVPPKRTSISIENESSNGSTESNDSDVVELNSIQKLLKAHANDSFGKNLDTEKEVLERWRIKKRTDPNINMSMSNYKLKRKGDTRPYPQRRFKPNIFSEETIPELNLSDNEKKNLDQRALNNKLADLALREQRFKQQYLIDHISKLNQLKQAYAQNIQSYKNNTFMNNVDKKRLLATNEAYFADEVKKLESSKNNFVHQVINYAKTEEKALKDLFESGNYVKGNFSEYYTLEVTQPKATRRNYVDDGTRFMLLPKNKIKNVLIEDYIYEYYYGKPK